MRKFKAMVITSLGRRRRGTILIFVVTLLVLLALLGTAFLSTTRIDRTSSAQAVIHSQVDLLSEGLRNIVQGFLAAGQFGTDSGGNPQFQPALTSVNQSNNTWHPWTYAASDPRVAGRPQHDAWLADRTPVDLRQRIASLAGAANPVPAWKNITWNLLELRGSSPNNLYSLPDDAEVLIDQTVSRSDLYFVPTVKTINGVNYPAFDVINRDGSPVAIIRRSDGATIPGPYLAGDADGDGIADSMYVRLPVRDMDDLTFYAAVRIIDNNSAINFNTAWSRDEDFDSGRDSITGGTLPNWGFFTTGVGLMEMLLDPGTTGANRQQMHNLIVERSGGVLPDLSLRLDTGAAAYTARSQGEAMYMQLGRRLGNPAPNTAVNQRYQALGLTNSAALASNFLLVDLSLNPDSAAASGSAPTPIERLLAESLYTTARGSQYLPGAVQNWFNQHFNFFSYDGSGGINGFAPPGQILSLRPLLTGTDATSILAPTKPVDPPVPAYAPTVANMPAAKTNINTAGDAELRRAFYWVMSDDPASADNKAPMPDSSVAAITDPYYGQKFDPVAPFNPVNTEHHPARMFRSPLRTPGATAAFQLPPSLPPSEIIKLRAAIATVNALDLRDTDEDVTSRNIALNAGRTTYTAVVYGFEKQPFITDVFVHTDADSFPPEATGPNPNGYIAIEIYNPYDDVDLDISGYEIAVIDRTDSTTISAGYASIFTFPGGTVIPARSFRVLENHEAATGAGTALYRPASSGLPATGDLTDPSVSIYIANLHEAIGKELVLLRPLTVGGSPAEAPVDSFDFTGLPPAAAGSPAIIWHYSRATDPAAGKHWHFVYPGRYDGSVAAGQPRHQGTHSVTYTPINGETDPWDPNAGGTAPSTPTLGQTSAAATYPVTFPIQLNNTGWPTPDLAGAYPFRAFARNGDILQVPFIGGYRIVDAGNSLRELNAITMDSVFAEDTDVDDDTIEQIGRFCPLFVPGGLIDDHAYGVDPATYNYTGSGRWRYHWATKLFDFFTVLDHPADDRLPDALTSANYVQNGPTTSAGQVNGDGENTIPVHGKININTASAKVLSMLPMVVNPGTGKVDDVSPPGIPYTYRQLNAMLADAIVYFRDVNAGPDYGNQPYGPFRSIMDLNRVVRNIGGSDQYFITAFGTILSTDDPDDLLGDITPLGDSNPDEVTGDFESRFLVFTRISNLITTRSDTFTVYVTVEGWRDAGTANAQRVVQRRAAYIMDRSGVTSVNRNVATTRVPTR